MTIPAGTRLEHYEILGPLGAGGMGEVFRALDTKLKRDVAIKLLPSQFARDPGRLARFEREALVLAQLNHPNIAAIYSFEHASARLPGYPDGARFLVLELVEGPTLAERLNQGRLDVPEALRIATQIAEAMEAAHDKGVLHRDLKPANIKIAPNGKVKVLDFGLAKALGAPEVPSEADGSETITMGETRAGVVMGTAPYMSPEQATGKPTDKRTDIFSFGSILYEMLSGRRCFEGKSTPHIIVHVLEQTPDWSALPPLPSTVRDVLEGCLEKDPQKRRRDIGDLRVQLESSITKPVEIQHRPHAPAARKRWLWPSVAAAVLLLAGAATYAYVNSEKPPLEAVRFDIGIPSDATGLGAIAVSPDGREVAFTAVGPDGRSSLWVRRLDAAEARRLQGTEGVSGVPFWSADSRSIVFGVEQKMMKIEAAGGPAQTLSDLPAPLVGGFWTDDNQLLFGLGLPSTGHRVSSAGGAAQPVSSLTKSETYLILFPSSLPDQKHFLFSTLSSQENGIWVATLEEGSKEAPRKLLADQSPAVYVPARDSDQGYLLFVRGVENNSTPGTLMAQPFDPSRNELIGEAVPIAENVTRAGFSASQTGVLVYSANAPIGSTVNSTRGVLTWLDRSGKEISTAGPVRGYNLTISLSPDGTRAAAAHDGDLWIYEFARGVDTRFTFEKDTEFGAYWRPDGGSLIYTQGVDLYQKSTNGTGAPVLFFKNPSPVQFLAGEWTPDGRYVAVGTGGNISDAWLLSTEGTPEARKLIPLLVGPFNERGIRFPADGRYFSYTSNETGQEECYVRPFDPATGTSPGGKWMISKGGGVSPHWRADGKEMYYVSNDGWMMAVPIDRRSGFAPGAPERLFKLPGAVRFWDVTKDGKKFLVPIAATAGASQPYSVILNWTSILKKN